MNAVKWNEFINTECKKCNSVSWRVARVINRGGQETFPLVCGSCGYKTAIYMPKTDAHQYGFNLLPDSGEAPRIK
jgi:uncharacterized Zn finger protein